MDARRREGLGDHAWDDGPDTSPGGNGSKREVCKNWQQGKCSKGDKCPRRHVGASGSKAPSPPRRTGARDTSAERPIDAENKRCDADIQGKKCIYGKDCYFAHRHAVNPRKDAAPRTPPKDHSDKVCNGCGEKGHIVWKCEKVKAHTSELKAAIGYSGDPKWLMNKENSKKCIALFKQRQWFAAAVHKPMPPIADNAIITGDSKAKPSGKLPFTVEKNPIDAGWCWLGWGAKRIQLRLYIDLGATCSFSTQGIYAIVAPKATSGELGCARIASEVPKILSDAWDGRKIPMKNWMQLTVTAYNTQGIQTICVGQYVSFGRAGDDEVLVAGKDLARALGFALPAEQMRSNRMSGIDPAEFLGDKVVESPRSYVLSSDERIKREQNRKMMELCLEVHAEGLAYIAEEAFEHVRPMQWAYEPLLQHSYTTTAAIHQAGRSASKLAHEGIANELAVGDMSNMLQWISGDVPDDSTSGVVMRVIIDTVRVTCETKPLRRLTNVEFRVVRSMEKRVVFGKNVLDVLEAMDDDQPDPFQSDHDFDEEKEIKNYLEATFDHARIEGLPKKHEPKYRDLIFRSYYQAFRLRLGREDPAILPELNIKTIPGAKMRPGYKIGFDKLTQPQLAEMKAELERMKSQGVVGDAPLDSILHSLLTLGKNDGSLRWVIMCMTANDITIDYWWDQPDNATSQQQRLHGAKYFWIADLLKGYWQIRLHKDCQWMFCFGTPWGPMKYLRAPMGCKATGPFFDMCVARILEAVNLLRKGVEMIHDDAAGASDTIYDDDEEGRSHFHLLRRYLKVCTQHRIRISPKKFTLFTKRMDFGGILHEDGGMRPSPARFQALLDQPDPTTLDEVYTGMCSTGWNRSYIPNFAVIEQPVRAFVMAKLGAGKKSKQRAKRIKLATCNEWTPSLQTAYKRLKLALIHAVKRAYRNYDWIAVLLWDASKYAWSYTITQVAPEELAKPWTEQQHQILVTRSGLFKGAQISWHPGCKEAYPPVRAYEVDGQFLSGKHPFIAAGDHKNILYIMHRQHRPKILKKTSHDRLNRWCLKWRHADFQMYHVPGVMNLFNDFHTRAGAPGSGPFFTLADHADKLEQKLARLERDVERGTPGAASKSGEEPVTPADADTTGTPTPDSTTPVRQHLLITEPMPQPTDALDKHEKNLPGESLLPYLPPNDWPTVATIQVSQ